MHCARPFRARHGTLVARKTIYIKRRARLTRGGFRASTSGTFNDANPIIRRQIASHPLENVRPRPADLPSAKSLPFGESSEQHQG
jgi:hypothetical protein